MWLVNTATKKLESFVSEEDVEYTILSHRWEEEEVLFEDMTQLDKCNKAGKRKLEACCKLVLEAGHQYVWIDTCCIDKKSSAELSEAINSMYRYYACAQHCFAYLCDVTVDSGSADFEVQFTHSQWFTRCWTLQELVAPDSLHMSFYNASWHWLGLKHHLIPLIVEATSIDRLALLYSEPSRYSIAQRMSWASQRRATRSEDVAYSLMGIFDINMPMLYGEGTKAFIRLQEEILKYNKDETIFAWSAPILDYSSRESHPVEGIGLLASSPAAFASCRHMKSVRLFDRPGFSLTSRGISGQIMAQEIRKGVLLAALNAILRETDGVEQPVGIYLQQLKTLDQPLRCSSAADGSDYLRVPLTMPFDGVLSGSMLGLSPVPARQSLMTLASKRNDSIVRDPGDRWEGQIGELLRLNLSKRSFFVRHKGAIAQHSLKKVYGLDLEDPFELKKDRVFPRTQVTLAADSAWEDPVSGWNIIKTGQRTGPVCNIKTNEAVVEDIEVIQLGFLFADGELIPSVYCILVAKSFRHFRDKKPSKGVPTPQSRVTLHDLYNFKADLSEVAWAPLVQDVGHVGLESYWVEARDTSSELVAFKQNAINWDRGIATKSFKVHIPRFKTRWVGHERKAAMTVEFRPVPDRNMLKMMSFKVRTSSRAWNV